MRAVWRIGWPYALGLLGGALGALLVIFQQRGLGSLEAAGWAAAIGTLALAAAAIGAPLWQERRRRRHEVEKRQNVRAMVRLALCSAVQQLIEIHETLRMGLSSQSVHREITLLDRRLERLRGLYLHALDMPAVAEVVQVVENTIWELLAHNDLCAAANLGKKERSELCATIGKTCLILAEETKARQLELSSDLLDTMLQSWPSPIKAQTITSEPQIEGA